MKKIYFYYDTDETARGAVLAKKRGNVYYINRRQYAKAARRTEGAPTFTDRNKKEIAVSVYGVAWWEL